ncbi:MAG: hypothetical protein K9N38_03570 [Candidatus Marinimicrobia bacterium]|nr:hypothetical protein [Candidatus Neomarinimicrobiota bacterium]MCF7850500.1 hypothetical protein [Candidatus Neomarinimicrobiota bacterium]
MHLPFGYILKADFHGGSLAFTTALLILFVLVLITNRRRVVQQGSISLASYLLILSFRMLISLILLILVFDPEIELQRQQTLPQRVAFVVDRSMSMTKAWDGDEKQVSVGIRDFIQEAESRYEIDIWGMDGALISRDDIGFDQEYTAFEWSPELEEEEKNKYQAVMIFSDGHLNQGRSPLDMSWTSSLPIFPVLPGKPRTNQSLTLVDLDYTLPSAERDPLLLNLRLQQDGLIGDELQIVVKDDQGEVLAKKNIQVDQMMLGLALPVMLQLDNRQALTVEVLAGTAGIRLQKSLVVKPENHLAKILLASERPDLQYKFLVQSIPDSLFTLRTYLAGTTESQGASALEEPAFDLLILNEPGSKMLARFRQGVFTTHLEENKPLIVFWSGADEMDREWQELLKVKQAAIEWQGEFPAGWELEALDHPLYLGSKGAGFEPVKVERFPPVMRNKFMIYDSGPPLLNVNSGELTGSVLALSEGGSRAYFNGGDLWKWHFQPDTWAVYRTFWVYLLDYLVSLSDFKPVDLTLAQNRGETGDYIPVNIEVRDIDGTPVFSEVRLWQENTRGDQYPLNVERKETGLYLAQVNTRNAGSFSLIAEAYRFGELWGSDTSRMELTTFNEEGQSEGVDRVFLQRLAEHSDGGRIISTIDNLPIFPDTSFERTTSIQLKGLRSASLFYLLILLMVLEWTIRRRNGLL